MLVWLFKRKKYVAPWWAGYINFPSEHTTEIAIVLSNEKIIVIDNENSRVLVYINEGGYLNKKIAEFSV